jgi:hypothetical protein
MENVSSEEELLQLRNDGKVSEAEYQDLLAAMRNTSLNEDEKLAPGIDKTKPKRKLGVTAFVLMLVGIVLPVVFYLVAETAAQAHDANMHVAIGPWFFLGIAFEITALTLGIISWRNDYGKVATIISGIILFLAVLFIVLTAI